MASSSEFTVEGQEPSPLSPIDIEPPAFQSLGVERRASIERILPLPASSNLPGAHPSPNTSFTSPVSPPTAPSTTTASLVEATTATTEDTTMRSPTPLAELPATEAHPNDDATTTTAFPPAEDVTTSLLGANAGPNGYQDYEMLTGDKPVSAKQLEEKKKHTEEKSHDPAVMYNIPVTPNAQAFEVAEHNVDGYFKPEFPLESVTPTPPGAMA